MLDIFTKGLMFEFLKGNDTLAVFIFSLPPQSIRYGQGQRVVRTKTYGGVYEDHYGADNPTINISGTTGGLRAKAFYRGISISDIPQKIMAGQEEIFYIRDRIINYMSDDILKDTTAINFYDLSSIDYSGKLGHAYQVSFDNFSIEKTTEKRFLPQYSIDLFCIAKLDKAPVFKAKEVEKTEKKVSKLDEMLKKLNTAKATIRKAMNPLKKVNKFFNEVNKAIEVVGGLFSMIDEVRAVGNAYLNVAGQTMNAVSNMTYTAIDGAFKGADVLKDVYRVVNMHLKVAKFHFDAAVKLANNSKKVLNDVRKIANIGNEYKEFGNTQVQRVITAFKELEKTANSIVEIGKSSEGGQQTINYSGSLNNTAVEYKFKGYTQYNTLKTDTLERVAYNQLGDSSLSFLLSTINNCNNYNLPDTILLPVSEKEFIDYDIFDKEHLDKYGVDIKLDGGAFSFKDNDFVVVQGEENVSQAINNRLNTTMGTRRRLTSYGALVSVGEASIVEAYIKTNMNITIKRDKRVKEVKNISIKLNGDSIIFENDIVLVDEKKASVVGVTK